MNKIELMTHVVAGYRSQAETFALAKLMAAKGVDYIEVQIPFSDPIGDGHSITAANQYALEHGMTVKDSFALMEQMVKEINIPLFFMTYLNPVYKMGFRTFFSRAASIGVRAVIIPDLPFLSDDAEIKECLESAQANKIGLIPVISPNTTEKRMSAIATHRDVMGADAIVYCTQRTGVTGVHESTSPVPTLSSETEFYLKNAKEIFNAKTAAGFGISSVEKVAALVGKVDIAVIGSHIINLYKETMFVPSAGKENDGLRAVGAFLDELDTYRNS